MVPYELPLAERVKELYKVYEAAFNENKELNLELKKAIEDRNELARRFRTVKVYIFYKKATLPYEPVKRKRRSAKDIERPFYCPIEKCRRLYGSEGSLCHHVRIKHSDFYVSGKF